MENITPFTAPSLRLILAAVILSKPGGMMPIKATMRPKKNTSVRFKKGLGFEFKLNISNGLAVF